MAVLTLHLRQRVHCNGHDGVVVAVVPSGCNPLTEAKRRGIEYDRLEIHPARGGVMPLREAMSYLVVVERKGKRCLHWPRNCGISV